MAETVDPIDQRVQLLRERLNAPPLGPEGITSIANQYGVDPALVAAVIRRESSNNPYAESPKGAQGLMQLLPATAAQYGVQNPFDPTQNVTGGTQYLRDLLQQYQGDVRKALAAYNAGPGAVNKYGGVPPYPETQGYVSKIMSALSPRAADAAEKPTVRPETLDALRSLRAEMRGAQTAAPATVQGPSDESITTDPTTGNAKVRIDITRAAGEAPPPQTGTEGTTTPERSTGEQLLRAADIGLVQGPARGILDVLGTPGDLYNLYTATAYDALKRLGINIPDPGRLPIGSQDIRQFYEQTLPDFLGIQRPTLEPQTPTERIIDRASRTGTQVLVGGSLLPGGLTTPVKETALGATSGGVGGTVEEVTDSPIAGAIAQGATALSPTAFRAGKAALEKLPPGRVFRRNQAVQAYEEAKTTGQAALNASEQAIDQQIAASQVAHRQQLDALELQRRDFQTALNGYDKDIEILARTGQNKQAASAAAQKRVVQGQLQQLDQEVVNARQVQQAQLDALQEAKNKAVQQAQEQALQTRQQAATTARQFVQRYPVPTDAEIQRLYADVDTYRVTLPTDLLRRAQEQLQQEVETVEKFLPGAALGERARLARPGPAIAPVASQATPEVELQQFIKNHGGIRLAGEELQGELRRIASPKETGTTGLVNNTRGLPLQTVAENAAEAGYIQTADKEELLRALDRSVRGQPTYSAKSTRLANELGDFFDRQAGNLPTIPGEITFQDLQKLQTYLGQRIRDLSRSTASDAGQQLRAASLLYSRLGDTLDEAIQSGTIPDAAKTALMKARSAYKVKKTVESLEDVTERFVTDGKLNAAGFLDYLRKNKDGGYLAQRLDEIGQLQNVQNLLGQVDADIKQSARNVPATRQQFANQQRQLQRQGQAQTAAQGQQRQALQDQIEEINRQIDQRLTQIREQGTALGRQQAAYEDALTARLQQQKEALQARLDQQRADIPPQSYTPGLGTIGGGGFALSRALGYENTLYLSIPFLLSRALITPPGQRLVGLILRQNGGRLDPASLRTLASTLLRLPEQPVPAEER